MIGEKGLRKIAREELGRLARIAEYEPTREKYPNLTDDDWIRVIERIVSWSIPDLLPGGRDGYWWPKRGRNYGHVHISHADPGEIVISRGGPGESSKHTSMYLTPDEAEELASLLFAAARHTREREAT